MRLVLSGRERSEQWIGWWIELAVAIAGEHEQHIFPEPRRYSEMDNRSLELDRIQLLGIRFRRRSAQ
jgi:hypothetical protein